MRVQAPSKSRKLSLALFAICTVVAACVFAITYDRHEAIIQDNNQFNTDTKIAQIDGSATQYSLAAQMWLEYAQTTPNKTHQIDAYASAAAMYVSAKKYQQALTVIQTAQAKDGQNYLLAEAGGQAAYALGDKPQTITYYKEVLKLLPKSLQDYIEEARDYQQTIQQLEQSP